jgi:hypothetical protein
LARNFTSSPLRRRACERPIRSSEASRLPQRRNVDHQCDLVGDERRALALASDALVELGEKTLARRATARRRTWASSSLLLQHGRTGPRTRACAAALESKHSVGPVFDPRQTFRFLPDVRPLSTLRRQPSRSAATAFVSTRDVESAATTCPLRANNRRPLDGLANGSKRPMRVTRAAVIFPMRIGCAIYLVMEL